MNITILDNTDKLELTTSISEKANAIHTHTAEQAGADPVGSAASALESAKSYTDTKIADLINGAPTTLDTLGEIATAMADNADVVEALNESIGSKANAADLAAHAGNKSNPHEVNLGQLGVTATATELNYVDGVTSNIQTQLNAKVPTSRTINGKALSSDISLTASDVSADASGSAASALTNAKSYTDTKIADLINSAPTTLDTLGEIATAMEENEDVVKALESAVGTKANASDLTSHTGNKSNPHAVTLSQLGVSATAAELNYVDGVTSNIQTQLDGKAASSHTQAASTITAGTFAGAVVAQTSSQTPGTSLLRNSKLVTTDTDPSYNGEICWTYE